ncbi:MAG: tRNA (guanine(10)-N(2))-dimethyltransferase [Candidatus Micrarchaeota archaeon]
MEKMKLTQITEGSAKLLVPEGSFKDPFHLPVFYNPAMRFNRSLSSLALECCLSGIKDAAILDGLCSLGARGIRYAKECKIREVHFVDANPDAIKVLRKNIKLNKIRNAKIAENDLNKYFLHTKAHFDFIEIDPFGSPVFFLQNAIRRLKKRGVLSITATDLANLAGANARPCIKHYGARPLRCEYSHEVALRILVGRIARELMMQDFGCTPLLSFYRGHAIKAIVLAEKSAGKADAVIPELGFIMHCPKCLMRESGKRQLEKCPNCGNAYDYAGELWIGKLQNSQFLECVRKGNQKRGLGEFAEVEKMLLSLKEENDFGPAFYDLHALAKKLGIRVRKTVEIEGRLAGKGFTAKRCHFSPTGIKTNAPLKDILKVIK